MRTISKVTRTNGFVLKIGGIDLYGNGFEYLTGLSLPIYASKAGVGLTDTGYTIKPARQNKVGSGGALPFTYTNTDSIFFTIDY